MNVHLPASRHGWAARLANLAVVLVLIALAAATFVLSYTGVHQIALQAGVSARLARVYPGIFDAVLVIACVAAVMLRDARLWARCYAWLAIIVVIGVVGAADVAHAMHVTLPHRQTEAAVAAAPWVLVLLGFSLMLTMLRQPRGQHTAEAPAGPSAEPARQYVVPALPPAAVPNEREAQRVYGQAAQAPPAEPPTTDDLPLTLSAPVVMQHGHLPPTQAAEREATAPQSTAAQDTDTQDTGTQDTGRDVGDDIEPAEPPPTTEGWPERVVESGEHAARRHDYWDEDVPRLNRVRATPVPPGEDED